MYLLFALNIVIIEDSYTTKEVYKYVSMGLLWNCKHATKNPLTRITAKIEQEVCVWMTAKSHVLATMD